MDCCSHYEEVVESAGIVISSLWDAATTQTSLNSDLLLNSLKLSIPENSHVSKDLMTRLVLADPDPATAKLVTALGHFLVPKTPTGKFPRIAYAPTEPLLIPTRRAIPPLIGVDVSPVVWFGFISFLNKL